MKNNTARAGLIIFFAALAVYLFPLAYNRLRAPFFAPVPSSDVIPASLVSFSLLREGDFYLDEYAGLFKEIASNWGTSLPYFVVSIGNHLVSDYPIATGILALPMAGLSLGAGWIVSPLDAFLAAKFTAAFVTACSVLAFFFCCRELADLKTSIIAALAFAFGTSVWSTASQGLWQHTGSILFQTLALWFILRGRRAGAETAAPAGLFLAAAIAARPSTLPTALILSILFFLEYRRALLKFAGWGIAPAILVLAYNTTINNNPLTFGFEGASAGQWTTPSFGSLAGILISPSRGLLVFSPFLILALAGFWRARREPARRFYLCAGIATGIALLILSAWADWWGGWGYGPRLTTDLLPLVSLLLLPAISRLGVVGKRLLIIALVYAALLQSLGLWDYGVQWHYQVGDDPAMLWDIGSSEPFFYTAKVGEILSRGLGKVFPLK